MTWQDADDWDQYPKPTNKPVYEAVGGPYCGRPIELGADASFYVIPNQGYYSKGCGKYEGKLVWKEVRG